MLSDEVKDISSHASNHYVEELNERVKKKTKRSFLKDLEKINSSLSTALEIFKESKKKKEDWLLTQDFYRSICEAMLTFIEATDWLHDALSLATLTDEKIDVTSKLENDWIAVARRLVNALRKMTSVYTTYKDSLGMGNGDCSISNLFLNLEQFDYDKRPYFADSLRIVASTLLINSELDLAYRYALMSAIEAIWDQYRYDKDDVLVSLMEIPNYFWRKEEYDSYVNYVAKTLDWLYKFYLEWGLQYDAYLYIQHFHLELLESFGIIPDVAKHKAIEYWKRVSKILVEPLHGGTIFDDFLLSYLIDTLVKVNRYDDAFEIVKARIDTLVSDGRNILERGQLKLDELLNNIQSLVEIGFNLKAENAVSLRKNLDMMKSSLLENKVSELAEQLGYTEKEDREWAFKSQDLRQFIKDKKTKTVEIDVHQRQTQHILGKERKILFLAECKYRKKPATKREVEFFFHKAKDLLEQHKDFTRPYPKKSTPRIGELWFVSTNGFYEDALTKILRADGCKLKLMDGNELNDTLAKHNLSRIPLV